MSKFPPPTAAPLSPKSFVGRTGRGPTARTRHGLAGDDGAAALRQTRPNRWVNHGPVSRLAARVIRPKGPPVLVLSIPRSGSSWVGEMLGSASDAMYLREPVTQSDPEVNRRVVFDPYQEPALLPAVRRLADLAFGGVPDFPEKVVIRPHQWGLKTRRSKRVVIKEVNPLACRWFVDRYRPRVVTLLRHPAATAMSSQNQAWLGTSPDDWAVRGRDTGRAWLAMADALDGYADCRTVFFEQLCRDPVTNYRDLFAFAGLTWDDAAEAKVADYGRSSVARIDAWRDQAPAAAVQALRDAYRRFDLEWYRGDNEW